MSLLAGTRVLDLSWIWAGPLVGAALAELGAEVVKVESSHRLDPYRLRGVERRDEYGDQKHEASPSFHKLNRTKKSIALNLRNETARDLLLRLIGEADLLIENFRAGTLDRLGLGWETLHGANPRLVALAMSAAGQSGRWRDLKAYALITTALAGYESLVHYDGEEPIGGATFGAADPTVSSFGVLAALASLYRARRTGFGVYIDLSGVESMIGVLGRGLLFPNGTRPSESVAVIELTLPVSGDDTWVACTATTDAQWKALGHLVGDDRWPAFDRVREEADARRVARRILELWSVRYALADLLAVLADAGLPAEPIVTVEERNLRPPIGPLFGTLEHPVTGLEPVHPSPWGTTVTPKAAPLLGEHTDEVLATWLGLSSVEVQELRGSGALA